MDIKEFFETHRNANGEWFEEGSDREQDYCDYCNKIVGSDQLIEPDWHEGHLYCEECHLELYQQTLREEELNNGQSNY